MAELIGLSSAQLRYVTKYADTLYREFDQPKKNGSGVRHIEDPDILLKRAQAKLAKLLCRITPPDYLFCPVKRRCYVTNAAQHRNHRVVRSLDVHKFFPSTTSRRVFWFFNSVMQCDRAMAGTLARLASYGGHLPTGSPLSPIMAYFAHLDMWSEVSAICLREGLTLTVYIDDVTVSGASVSDRVMWDIKQAIAGAGLQYHKEKAYFDRPAEVTGVFVAGGNISIPHKQYKKLRIGLAEFKASRLCQSKVAQEKLDGLKGQLAQIQKVAHRLDSKIAAA